MPDAMPATDTVPAAAPVATPAPAPKFDPTGRSYNSYEEFAKAWGGTKNYLKLTSADRTASFDHIKERWANVESERSDPATSGGQDFFGKVNEEAGSLAERGVGAVAGQTAGNVAGAITRAVVPPTNAQAAIDAVLFASGTELAKPAAELLENASAITRLGARLASTGLAGAAGGSVQGGTSGAATGGASGLIQGGVGEVASAVTGVARRAIQRADIKGLGDWLASELGEGTRGLPHRYDTLPKISNELVGGEAQSRLAGKVTKLSNKGPILKFNVSPDVAQMANLPSTSVPMSLRDANAQLEHLESIGWDTNFRQINSATAQKARSAVHQMEGTIAEALDQVNPKLAQDWYTARGQLRTAKMMSNLMREPDVVENGGRKLNMEKLQALLSDAGPSGYKMDLQQAVGPQGKASIERLTGIAQRGGTPGMTDVQGVAPHGGISSHFGIPHPYMTTAGTKFPRHVGYVPFDLGRGRAFTGTMVLGAHQFVNNLQDLPGDPNHE